MELKNSLYKIEYKKIDGDEIYYDISLNPSHLIYRAHFPGEPVTPGVCIIQIGKELLEDAIGAKLKIHMIKNVKFLSIISPVEIPMISYSIKLKKDTIDYMRAQILVHCADKQLTKISFSCQTK